MSLSDLTSTYLSVGGLSAGFVGGAVALLALIPPILELLDTSSSVLKAEIAKRRLKLIVVFLAIVAACADVSAAAALIFLLLALANVPAGIFAVTLPALAALVGAIPLIFFLAVNSIRIVSQ